MSYATIRYMIAEVHYGGRITDDFDRRLMNTYCTEWLNEQVVSPGFAGYATIGTGKDAIKYTTPYHALKDIMQ